MNDNERLNRIRAQDARWEPRCQFIKASEKTSKGYGIWGGQHPWPLSVEMASACYKLCGGKQSDHPMRFVGPEWNHDEFVYDPEQDSDPRASIRFLLNRSEI